MSEVTFEALSLAAPLQRALRDHQYVTPSPIQAQAIPPALEGRDILGCAQTGTGKTAAFALPILHKICENEIKLTRRAPRCLILTPTRELAVQVADSFAKYGQHCRFRLATVYGGVSQGPQVRNLSNGLDVLVATPGRLLDLYEQGHVDFGRVETFVLDEADRMLDMGFIHDIRKIVQDLPLKRQTLFFSATLSPEITKLASTLLTEAITVSVAPPATTAEKIDQSICFIRRQDKPSLLSDLIAKQSDVPGRQLTLVFSRTKHGADRLARNLARSGIKAEAIHGNKSQAARQKSLDRFRQGRLPVLVATDVAARGIDVKDVTLVINYDLPNEAESYVHRIGRTARAGASGQAISFCSDEEFDHLKGIEKLIRQRIPALTDHSYHADNVASSYEQALVSGGRSSAPRSGRGGGRRSGGRGGPQRRGGPQGRSGGGGSSRGGSRGSFGKKRFSSAN